VSSLLDYLRAINNSRLLELLNRGSNRGDKRKSESNLERANPHRLTSNLRGNFALDALLNNGLTGWRALFGYDNNNNVIFYGIGYKKYYVQSLTCYN
jgi:hypothetical protein